MSLLDPCASLVAERDVEVYNNPFEQKGANEM